MKYFIAEVFTLIHQSTKDWQITLKPLELSEEKQVDLLFVSPPATFN